MNATRLAAGVSLWRSFYFFTSLVATAASVFLSCQPAAAAPIVINSSRTFGSLDGSIGEDDDGIVNGIFTRNDGVVITGTGAITFNDLPATNNSSAGNINVASILGGLHMQSGARILAENTFGNGNGGNITLNLLGDLLMENNTIISSSKIAGSGDTGDAGNILMNIGGSVHVQTGASILANGTGSAGSIQIYAGKDVTIDGLVESHGGMSGVGANQPPGGGMIWIAAGPFSKLTVGDTGVIRSKGQDPGADLVHLEGCCVLIQGLVESTGVGHAVPVNPHNHLNGAFRPDKSPNSTAGIEIWAGQQGIIIDNTGSHNGQLNADLTGGSAGRSWIDIFAKGDIEIRGDANDPFVVHATNAGNNATGGTIQIKSIQGNVTATGKAVNASAGGSGFPDGGTIQIEAGFNVTLDTATLQAQGDFNPTGGLGNGGHIDVRAYNALISWLNGTGDVRPAGTAVGLSNPGTITLTDVNGVPLASIAGTNFPVNGLPANIPVLIAAGPGGAPTLAGYVVLPMNCIPEPGTLALLTFALLAVSLGSRRRLGR